MLQLFPEGFEELERDRDLRLVAYTDAAGEARARAAFESVEADEAPEDWADAWRAFHRGARVGRLWVGPPWEQPPDDAVPVLIDPGRAFGTGSHASTRLCLEFLQVLPAGSLVDVGCGSGVLAIAAAKLGFAPVVAIDNDPAAIEATAMNARANGVAVELRVADALADRLPETDVAVANLAGEAIPALPLRSALAVTSGYLEGDEVGLPAYERMERRLLEGWAADLFRRH
jgi:ribosomal protein L11 methyltransferase